MSQNAIFKMIYGGKLAQDELDLIEDPVVKEAAKSRSGIACLEALRAGTLFSPSTLVPKLKETNSDVADPDV
jgi:hypothetical protein